MITLSKIVQDSPIVRMTNSVLVCQAELQNNKLNPTLQKQTPHTKL